jgi:hypothetical protein
VKLKTWRSFRNEGGWSCRARLPFLCLYAHRKEKVGAAVLPCRIRCLYSQLQHNAVPPDTRAPPSFVPLAVLEHCGGRGGLDKPGRPAGTLEPRRRRITPRHARRVVEPHAGGGRLCAGLVVVGAAVRGADRGFKAPFDACERSSVRHERDIALAPAGLPAHYARSTCSAGA